MNFANLFNHFFRPLLCVSFVAILLLSQLSYAKPTADIIRETTRQVNTEAISAHPDNDWLSYGRSYHEQRFSPLKQITPQNVEQLGLEWFFETDYGRGLEATPIVVDGVMYVTGNWSMVYALDALSGELIWKYDPEVPKEWGKMACCDVVNRGVALYEGKVFVGTLDARLVALDAASGEVVWDVQTADISQYPYTITGAPRVAKGKVFIGNGGAEFGARGFVSAYDVDSGELAWRFYTVPGNPEDGFEDESLRRAAQTWTGEWWKQGGGGTVWDSIVYDPELDQLYIGVGNGSPWNRRIRSPEGGDNLYLSSIVALNPDTGEYIWHYQETPAETWDYTATQHIMLADMVIEDADGSKASRPVIWHAPKNGFFFIIDRSSGKLLSAEPYARVTWASHYDMETGRPVENLGADYKDGPAYVFPSGVGAHNWQPMAHSPDTGLVYIPAMESMFRYEELEEYIFNWGHFNIGSLLDQGVLNNDLLADALMPKIMRGHLLAWDPVAQREAWRVQRQLSWNGGLLATAGNLLFQGTGSSAFEALAADDGRLLWSFDTQIGIVGSPVTFAVDGEQYVTIMVGWGGALSLGGGIKSANQPERGRVMTFKLNATNNLPAVPKADEPPKPAARLTADQAVLDKGQQLYAQFCGICHGPEAVSNGRIPDLRQLPMAFYDSWDLIVLDGAMKKMGMVGFSDVLDKDDSYAIKAYVLEQANEDWELRQQPSWWLAIKRCFYEIVAVVVAWLAELQA